MNGSNTIKNGAPFDAMRSFIVSLAIPLLLFAAVYAIITPIFETNDDVQLASRILGIGTSAQPSEYLIFSHILLGMVLLWLTKIFGTLAYGIHTYFAIIFSATISNYSILRIKNCNRTVAMLALINVLVLTPVLARPQFTIVASMLTASAIFLTVSLALQRPNGNKALLGGICIASSALLYGFMVRYHASIMLLLIASPCVVLLLRTQRSFPVLKKLLPASLLVIICLFTVYKIDKQAYRGSPEWQTYLTVQPLRVHFDVNHNVTYLPEKKHVFDNAGWTENDLNMINSRFFVRQPLYNPGKLRYVADQFPASSQAYDRLSKLYLIFQYWIGKPYFIAVLSFSILLMMHKLSKRGRWHLVSSFVAMLMVFVGIHLQGRPPLHRVHFPAFAFILVLGTLISIYEQAANTTEKTSRIERLFPTIIMFLCALATLQLHNVWTLNRHNAAAVKLYQDDIRALQPKSNQLFVVWGGNFPYQQAFLPLSAKTSLTDLKLYLFGSTTLSPYSLQRLKDFNIDDLTQAFYRRDDVFLSSTKEKLPMLIQFIKQHYGVDVKAANYFNGKTFKVYRLIDL